MMFYPTMAFLYFLGMFPIVLEIYVSFTNWTPIRGNWWELGSKLDFVGINNYVGLATDELFLLSILRTVAIVVGVVLAEFLIGLGLAYLFLEGFRAKKIFTSVLFLPMMVVPAINGYIFFMLFLRGGPINGILSAILGQTVETAWLQQGTTALMAVMFMDIWQWTPLMFLILLSGFAALPQEPINAAYVLGASKWYTFRRIMLPLLKPIIIIAIVIRSMEALKLFDGVFILTKGGPGYATQTFSIYLYEAGFRFGQLAYVAAAALVILVSLAFIMRRAVRPLRLGGAE